MLSKCSSTKPLIKYQRNLDYEKHKQKLKQIIHRSSKNRTAKSIQIRPWIHHKLQNQTSKSYKIIEQQNQKLLDKLMKISNRQRQEQKVHEGVRHKANSHRKMWLNNIKKQNQDLGQKLINLKSELEYSRFSKNIEEYQKIKKIMKNNRKAMLPQIGLKKASSNYLYNFMKTQPSQLNTNDYNIQNEEEEDNKREIQANIQHNICIQKVQNCN